MLRRPVRPALLLLIAGLIATSLPVGAVAQQAEQRQLEAAQGRLAELSDRIDAAGEEAEDADDALEEADAQLRELEAIVNDVADRVERQRAAVADAQRRLAVVESEAAELGELFIDRVARMYKQGPELTFELMLAAESAEDAMARTSLLGRVAESDQVELEQLEAAQVAVDAERELLEAEQGQLEGMLVEQQELLERADALRERRALAAAEARAQLDDLHREHDDLEDEEAELRATIERLQEEQAAAEEARRSTTASSGGAPSATVSSTGHRWPVCAPVTSEYGPRWGRQHRGIDLGVATGTPIAASKAGTVIFAGSQGGYGNLVLVDHHDGLVTAYAHLSSFSASVGESVGQGQTIALSGNTGNSTGPHLHFETRANGTAVNPRQYLSGGPC